MNNKLIAFLSVLLAVTAMLASGAQAGFNVHLSAPPGFAMLQKSGCGGSRFRAYRRYSHRSVKRHVKPKIAVARAEPAKTETIAKVEAKPEEQVPATSQSAETENSSIATAAEKVAEAQSPVPPKKVAAAKDVGCKQFFPSVGLTLSVSCE